MGLLGKGELFEVFFGEGLEPSGVSTDGDQDQDEGMSMSNGAFCFWGPRPLESTRLDIKPKSNSVFPPLLPFFSFVTSETNGGESVSPPARPPPFRPSFGPSGTVWWFA